MKRMFAILLTLLMVISMFAGCDINHDHETTIGPTENTTDLSTAAGPAEDETEAPVETTVPETEAPTQAPAEEPKVEETGSVHQHSYERKVTAEPTCSNDGEATYTCSCGASYTESIAAEHAYECTDTRPATCSNTGDKTYTCNNCGHSYKETLPKNEHIWSEWKVTKEPTTTTYGKKVRICELCYGAQEVNIDPLPADETELPENDDGNADCAKGKHNYVVNTLKEPTCEEYGRMSTICSACGELSIMDSIPPTGHSWGNWVSAGGTDTRTCSTCGKSETRKTPANVCEEHGYSHIMSDTDKARLTAGDYFYEVNCICGLACIGSSYDDAWAKFTAHAAEKQYNYCGEVRWESEGYWVEFPNSTYACARCGTVVEFRHYLCRTSS